MSTAEQLRERTKKFALRVIRLFQALPKTTERQENSFCVAVHPLQRIIVRHAVGDLKAEFIARLGIVAEEADESVLWLELLEEANILKHERLAEIMKEAKELVAIFSTSLKTAKGNK